MREYCQADLAPSAAQQLAREAVLEALSWAEPKVLKSLAERCYRRVTIQVPTLGQAKEGDWCESDSPAWAHLRDAGKPQPSAGYVIYGNLVPLKDALIRWMKDGRQHRWNLCDNDAMPLDWLADAALQTLDSWWASKRLPKNLRWATSGELDHHWSLPNSEMVHDLLDLESQIEAPVGPQYSRLSYRDQRRAERQYRSLMKSLGPEKVPLIARRHCLWYALQTFLGLTRREIRKRTKANVGDQADLTAISHGISSIADLVGFRRQPPK